MGTWYRCKCNNLGCGYEIFASPGIDRGRYSRVKTMVCMDCNEIKKICIGQYDINHVYTKINELVCPTCKSENLKDWNDELCPQCKNLMIIDEDYKILWD